MKRELDEIRSLAEQIQASEICGACEIEGVEDACVTHDNRTFAAQILMILEQLRKAEP